MIGGIYCESNLGPIYSENTLESVRQKFRRLVDAGEIVPKGETLNEQIVNHFYDKISSNMGKILSSWKVPTNRQFYNRTVDLTRSICLGVYHKGKLMKMYRFSGGSREKGYTEPSDMGSNSSGVTSARLEIRAHDHHPDPASRARQFLQEYDVIYKNDFTVVIAATMPYAVRLETTGSVVGKNGKTYSGYGLHVLKDVSARMLKYVFDFKNRTSGTFYGYVFESSGGFS